MWEHAYLALQLTMLIESSDIKTMLIIIIIKPEPEHEHTN